jgi:hypothetical protein
VSSDRSIPFPVVIAVFVGYALAAGLLFFGLVGVAAADEVSDPFGVGLLVLGVVILGATILLGRGSNAARLLVSGLAAITFVVAVVYAFAGPSYAVGPGLATALVTLGPIVLLYRPQVSKDFFAGS